MSWGGRLVWRYDGMCGCDGVVTVMVWWYA
jgi:hypothetical protein